jgi:tetratricopeptide (TPR) repeat protein
LAATLWQESLRLDGTNLRANSSLGQLLYHEGRYLEAIDYLEHAASVDNYARSYLGWSRIMLALDRNDTDLQRTGLKDLTEALRRWAYQNSDGQEKQSWFRHVRRLSQLGESFQREADQLVAFANSNSRWGSVDVSQLHRSPARDELAGEELEDELIDSDEDTAG